MKNLIPFYTEKSRDTQAYTLFLDQKSKKVYKAYHKKTSTVLYWIAFVLALALLRILKDVYYPINTLNVILLFVIGALSIILGLYFYKFAYEEKKEVFQSEYMVERYIEKGEKVLKIEVITTSCIFIAFIIVLLLFLFNNWLPMLLLAIALLIIFVTLLCRLPVERFKLNKTITCERNL